VATWASRLAFERNLILEDVEGAEHPRGCDQ
jgi:hypothetical protein